MGGWAEAVGAAGVNAVRGGVEELEGARVVGKHWRAPAMQPPGMNNRAIRELDGRMALPRDWLMVLAVSVNGLRRRVVGLGRSGGPTHPIRCCP